MNQKIAITSVASFSPLGMDAETIWNNYLSSNTLLIEKKIGNSAAIVAPISIDLQNEVALLKASDENYKSLDNSVLFAIIACRRAIEKINWKKDDSFGINIGSSRGATHLFEKNHKAFLSSGTTSLLSSPSTTLGNISSWVAHDLQVDGPEFSHSITCSTALHSVLNGIAWLKAGMADKFLVGGSEAPLTSFTIAQMRALKIYAKDFTDYPCLSLDIHKTKNTMALGEGASIASLQLGEHKNALAYIDGIGYATELMEHHVAISTEADCFQKSMKMAIGKTDMSEIDVVVMHAPGTIKGDLAEFKAIQKVFGNQLPLLTSNKWKIGHTFGASGMLSLEMGVLMMQHNHFIPVPYLVGQTQNRTIRKVLINAVGFGGNAVSIVLSKP